MADVTIIDLDQRLREIRMLYESHNEAGDILRWASMSPVWTYRYVLGRQWIKHFLFPEDARKEICFIMLNPSTADAQMDDPTVRRCMAFARLWGFSTLTIRNLFALRATDPRELLSSPDPIGPLNNEELRRSRNAQLILVAWGAKVPFGRDKEVLDILEGMKLFCLGTTKDGHPRHPLYCRADLQPIPWEPPS